MDWPTDDPEMDGTDGAHPAWWRGHDHTAAVFCQKVQAILDGKDDGAGFNYEPWGALRRRLIELRTELAERTRERDEWRASAEVTPEVDQIMYRDYQAELDARRLEGA